MLTQVDELGVSGISGVEWDAVELPSQFMENFCWEWDVLKHLTRPRRHRRAAAARAVRQACWRPRTSRAACGRCARSSSRCSTCAAHRARCAAGCMPAVLDEVRARGGGAAPRPHFNRFAAQLLAHLRRRLRGRLLQLQVGRGAVGRRLERVRGDAARVLDVETGRRYRESILEAGGSRSAMDSFKAFRGREPRIDALLRHQGIGLSAAWPRELGLDSRPSCRSPMLIFHRSPTAQWARWSWRCRATPQYKVVGPDGKVTYTDRPPAADRRQGPARSDASRRRRHAPTSALPLRAAPGGGTLPGHAVHHAPTAATLRHRRASCCAQRGVPYTEKQVQRPTKTPRRWSASSAAATRRR